MFLTLLLATFLLALATSIGVAYLFRQPLERILDRLVGGELADAWQRYLLFAIVVVGVAGGGRIGSLMRYIEPFGPGQDPVQLDANRWTLELYQTILGTLQSIAWMLLVFFVFALIAYVIVRAMELRSSRQSPGAHGS